MAYFIILICMIVPLSAPIYPYSRGWGWGVFSALLGLLGLLLIYEALPSPGRV